MLCFFNKDYILIFRKRASWLLLEMALYSRSTTWAKAMFVVVRNFFPSIL